VTHLRSKLGVYAKELKKEEFFMIGKPIPRINADLIVTGKAIYGYDVELPRMLYGKIKHSDVPHAELVRVDVEEALKLRGVRCVITGNDVPPRLRGISLFDTPTLARDRVRYIGEPIAAVAADTPEIAQEAIELIDVEYKELPAVFDPEKAMKPDAPIIHPDLPSYRGSAVHGGRALTDLPNVNNYHRIIFGDVEKGFEKSDIIIENKYETSMVHTTHMEPNACVCNVEPDGTLTVYTSTQAPYRIRTELHRALGIPENKIRVIGTYTGGGFGNKLTISAEAICSVLALKARRPVKIALTREEVFWFTTVRHPFKVYVKDGVSKDGRIISRYVKAILNGGAYSGGSGIVTTRNAGFALTGTYKVENLKFESFRVYTNLPPGGAFRGFGTAQIDFAIEQQMDIIARELGMDPIEFRLKNVLEEGDINVLGETMRGIDHKKVLLECAKAIGWGKRREKERGPWRRGVGIALTDKYSYAPTASSALIKVREDGTVEVYVLASEIGAGSHTVITQIVAEEFKIPIEKVELVAVADTKFAPFDEGAFSSRTTVNLGNAVILACRKVKENLTKYASKVMRERPENLDVRGGYIVSKSDPSVKMKIEELFARDKIRTGIFLDEEGAFVGAATWYTTGGILDPETGRIVDLRDRYLSDKAVNLYNTTATGIELEVNIETGQVRVLKAVGVSDCGKAINPRTVKGQIEGCITMGISIALYEEMVWNNGYLLNPDFRDYKVITVGDLPEIVPIIVETPLPHGPYGAKGIGEGVITSTVPAIANAIYDAIGVRMFRMPMTAEDILRALKKGGDLDAAS
jgi:CO/xanthine dehydrogenase Mo-binding subunit